VALLLSMPQVLCINATGFMAGGLNCTQGLPTIRAYGAQSRFRDDFLAQMDLNGSWWFAFIATARWVGFRLDNIAAAVLMLASIFVMALHSKVPELACLVTSNLLSE